jgi:hypothetical protein
VSNIGNAWNIFIVKTFIVHLGVNMFISEKYITELTDSETASRIREKEMAVDQKAALDKKKLELAAAKDPVQKQSIQRDVNSAKERLTNQEVKLKKMPGGGLSQMAKKPIGRMRVVA